MLNDVLVKTEVEVVGNRLTVRSDGWEKEVDLGRCTVSDGETRFVFMSDQGAKRASLVRRGNDLYLFDSEGQQHSASVPKSKWMSQNVEGGISGAGPHAPMPGVVEKILVSEGQEVEANDPLIVMIAMKVICVSYYILSNSTLHDFFRWSTSSGRWLNPKFKKSFAHQGKTLLREHLWFI